MRADGDSRPGLGSSLPMVTSWVTFLGALGFKPHPYLVIYRWYSPTYPSSVLQTWGPCASLTSPPDAPYAAHPTLCTLSSRAPHPDAPALSLPCPSCFGVLDSTVCL